ncbi:DMT family transporter [Aeromonas rivuli]|uniref:DMT family transporter n=1 Tax=Aeromonas rivuli TaxID=648794 RepID=UPI001CCC55B5|nr:DMT family transporter [Aeromonas rivuli]
MSHLPHSRLGGWAAALATVLLWSGFFLSLKAGAQASLPLLGLALLRYGIPALLLAPRYWQARVRFKAVPARWRLAIMVGAGLPFFWLGASGMQLAPVNQGSALIPGLVPLWVALLLWGLGERCGPGRRLGLSLIASALLVMILTGAPGIWLGQLHFIGAALLWALFTLGVKRSGLGPLDAAALVAVPSTLVLLPMVIWLGWPAGGTVQIWIWQGVIQGAGAGLGAALCYGHAIRVLGAEITSAVGSLTPLVASALACLLLGEVLTLPHWLTLALLAIGVMLASRVASPSALLPAAQQATTQATVQ